jgi:hypothetical protein
MIALCCLSTLEDGRQADALDLRAANICVTEYEFERGAAAIA